MRRVSLLFLAALLWLLGGCAKAPVAADRALPEERLKATQPHWDERAYIRVESVHALEPIVLEGLVYFLNQSGLGDRQEAEQIAPRFMQPCLEELEAYFEPLKMRGQKGVRKSIAQEVMAEHFRHGIEQDAILGQTAQMIGAFEDIEPLLGDYLEKLE